MVASSLMAAVAQTKAAIPIIDSHFHLYDPTRPQGAPFPFTPNAPPFLPKDFRASAVPLGIVGGIKVEASPWVEDNLWVLMMIEDEPLITGMIGNLDPAKPDFLEYLERYRKNKLFLGIRYGNVWKGQDLVAAIERRECIDNLKAFAATGLTLEVANPRFDLIDATLRLHDQVPNLRLVLGHLQALALPTEKPALEKYAATLRELKQRGAFVKVSGLHRARNATALDPAVYQPVMDFIWDIFGEDQLVYAGRNKAVLDTLMAYFLGKGRPAAEKFFWRNSVKAFRWIRRTAEQKALALA